MPFCSERCRLIDLGQLGVGEVRDLRRRSIPNAGQDQDEDDRLSAPRARDRDVVWLRATRRKPQAPRDRSRRSAIAWVAARLRRRTGPRLRGASRILLAIPGIWAAGVVARDIGKEDPQIVVVDEVVGQWMTLAGASTLNWKSWLLAFALFRLFDIWKPPPVRQLERLPGGLGIVADDAMAGVYGALVLFAAGWFNLY